MNELNKDFYDKLPGMICSQLDALIWLHGDEEWFGKMWEEYRQHILSCENKDEMRMPGFVLNKYLKEDKE